ncbi:kelch domain-containing protein 10 homolog [Uranotaenia lowii]|uniref:kelch domain-containing protein 10 homolog n=1 Tax=Uranotaenia lowii TaxID=190385 RepID=UPI002478C707|nr:kelch domain-containing protein 10 homolog [Uranotaenia lowii]
MKILILLLCRLLIRIVYFLNKFINVRKLQQFLEYLDACEELLEDMNSKSGSRRDSAIGEYTFRPFEVKRIKHKKSSAGSTPYARSGHRIVCNDSAVFCFGGFNPVNDEDESSCLFQELWKFNMITKEWTLLMGASDDLPHELASNAMAMHGDNLIIFGGTGYPFGLQCSNRLYVYQSRKKSKEVTEVEVRGDLPPAQYGQAILYHDGHLYTIGGTEGFDYTCDVFRLNIVTRTWECAYACKPNVREDPPGRYRHEIAFDGERIFIIGGGTSDSVFSLATIPTYDLKENVWSYTETKRDPSLPPPGVPAARKCHSCVQYHTDNGIEIIVAGGYAGRSHFGDIWKLNLSTFEWRLMQKSSLPYPLFFHDAASSSAGCMYIFGGIKFSRNARVTQMRTNVVFKTWMTIPKLSEICWEAMLHYYPGLPEVKRESLLELGIPIKFVQRVHDI